MNFTDGLQSVLSTSGTLNRYRLDIPSSPSPLDVEEFSGSESMSRMYSYDIIFTSTNKHLDASELLRKPASLTMGDGLLKPLTGQKKVHGVITDFRRLSGSADQMLYRVTLKPFLFLLDKQHRSHRFFVNKSVPEVVEQVLQEHGLQGWEYEFNLKHSYPKREQINQYHESDLAFVQRLLAEVGIFYWFTLQEDAQTEVVHFADAQRALMFGKTLPVNSPSGMSDSGAESVWGLNVAHNVVEANVTTKDYNHRDAQSVLQSAPADMTRGDGEGMTYGEVYHYQMRHLERGDKIEPQAETANFYARLDHERFLARQTLISAASTDSTLSPAQVLTITDSLPPTLPEVLKAPVLIVSTHFTASRKDALRVNIIAVPYSETLCWRPPLLPRPKVTGTMTARVTSAKANDIYAWQDASGLYRVKFDADRDDKSQGQESMPVRLAKPYGGDVYGFHFPLIQGTEVAIAFHEGDPDRPYIAHIAQRREGVEATRDFLDIFNHRLIAQYYRIWRKYSYPATFEAGGTDNTSQYLLGLAGLGIPGCADNTATPLSRFLALLPVMLLPGRTAEGIAALVQLLAPDTRATVYPHDRCRIELKHPLTMRTQRPIGLRLRPVMGTHGTDVNGQVLLQLTSDNPEEVRGWLPGGELHGDLMALLHVYLGSHLDVRIQLCVARHLLPDARLACHDVQGGQIGRTAVLRPLNAQQNNNDVITIHLGRYQRVQEIIHRRESDEDGDYRW